ncbi:phage terminase large subunit [Bosea sp. NBC_00550]|uniref:phage terminase large subunit n=1 Tax=Bosea sp. NBC_00550 TaxID=2969621 RepID=UPI00223260E1|nr:phage terminase large subunit [Bosea sp. NBC_00550]UZF94882.1 phage terminase large subunit [Bosea sp. NBC_00550]
MNDAIVVKALQNLYLFPFVWDAFELLHPGQSFIPSWHVNAMCLALEKVVSGETKRLIITVPPRHGKSICAAVALPAWMLGKDPSLKIMVASYGSDLAAKHARDFRTVITSAWYSALFPRTRLEIGGSRVDEQITTAQGGRKAVSLGGAVTGFGADLIIVDDLMKAADANSPAERQRVRDYYEQTLLSRLNNKSEGRIIIIQQRLHEDDLPGYLLDTGQFTHLNLPAIAVEPQDIPLAFGKIKHREPRTALCPEREPLDTLEKLRIEMGAYVFSAQYQQDPTPPGGNRIRLEWFGTYSGPVRREEFQWIAQSWDTALTAEPTSDFTVGTTWGFRDNRWHLLDVIRERLDFPELKRRVVGLANKWNADHVLIEHAGSGISLIQQLRHEETRYWRYHGTKPRLDKATRLEAQTARLETGQYLLPTEAHWLSEFRRELLAFPMGKFDDQVDSLVQFLEWSASPRASGFLVERHPETGRPLRVNRPQRRY